MGGGFWDVAAAVSQRRQYTSATRYSYYYHHAAAVACLLHHAATTTAAAAAFQQQHHQRRYYDHRRRCRYYGTRTDDTAAAAAAAVVGAAAPTTRTTTRWRQKQQSFKLWSSSSSSSSSTATSTSTAATAENKSTGNDSGNNDNDNEREDVAAASATASRLSRAGLSLELRTVTDHVDVVVSHLRSRRAAAETVEAARNVAASAAKRTELIRDRDAALQERKKLSAVAGKLVMLQNSKDGTELSAEQEEELRRAKAASVEAADRAAAADEQLQVLQSDMEEQLAGIPNLLDDVVPDGTDENDNEEIYRWGDVTALPDQLGWTDEFQPAWHDDVADGLSGYLAEAAVKMSGSRFVAVSGPVARLERALQQFMLDVHVDEHGYTEIGGVPLVVSESSLRGTSQLPKFKDDLFAVDADSHTCNGEDAYLIPTAEVPLTNLHRDEVLSAADLPVSYVAATPCFRAEAGSYGRDARGLIRTHQFYKVELVKICAAEASDAQHELLTGHAETVLRKLKLPYRKVRLCSGDTGFAARHCYDLEVWLPGAAEYREISSCSNTGDFQARRMMLRYRPADDDTDAKDDKKKKQNKKKKQKKPVYCHTINGSGLAVGRCLVAVLENYQCPDGSVVVPDVLRPYMGGIQRITATTATTTTTTSSSPVGGLKNGA